MNAPRRRGACPGLSDPMATGDGLLARLTPAGGTIAFDAITALCAAARRHGNGVLEITQRGSIQIRGLAPQSAPVFAEVVAALKIGVTQKVPVVVGPLSGLDPDELIDANVLAGILRRELTSASCLAMLGPKVSVVIDGGGALHLDALSADLRLRAFATPLGVRFHVAVGGNASTALSLGAVTHENAVDAALRILEAIAAQGPVTRARDMVNSTGAAQFKAAIAELIVDAPPPLVSPRAEPIGAHRLRNGHVAVGVGFAFGHAQSAALENLIEMAASTGAPGLRIAPDRALLIVGLAPEKIDLLAAAAEKLGFIVRHDDPRRRIAACPGAPACAFGLIAARALAGEIAKHLTASRDTATVHVSGCAKGCAHPGPCALTVVGTERGCGIVRHGSARATPRYHVSPADLVAEATSIITKTSEAAYG